MIVFEVNTIATQAEIDAERAILGRRLWPARLALLAGLVLLLCAGFQGSKEFVPFLWARFYGQEWPNGSMNLGDLMMLGAYYVVAFLVIAMPLCGAINYGADTYLFNPWRRLEELGPDSVSEAMRLAERWPSIESYRMAVARSRRFVFGDFELMLRIDEQEKAHALKQKRDEKRKADLMRLGRTE